VVLHGHRAAYEVDLNLSRRQADPDRHGDFRRQSFLRDPGPIPADDGWTDGFTPYRTAIPAIFNGRRIDYATLVKVYGESEEGSRRYSPSEIIGTIETPLLGEPEEARICTSHVERSNKTLRMQIRRLTRLTDAHSKKLANHGSAMALFFAYYNFCRVHMTLKATPAKAAGLTTETWSLERLLTEANRA
jgi:hypothetical protein